MTSYTTDDKAITYTYDANGLRASKIQKDYTVAEDGTKTLTQTTETKYYYVNGQLHYQDTLTTKSDGTTVATKLHFYYDSYGYLSCIKYNGSNYYVATNKRGDVVALYYYDGRIMGRYEYDAWGNVIKIEDISYDSAGNQVIADLTNNTTSRDLLVINPIRYRSYYYDLETDLYYLQSRYYNAQVGRFLNSDNISDSGAGVLGFNTFIYCANNPVNASDPSGHGVIWDWISDKITKLGDLCSSSFGKFIGMIEDTTKPKAQTPYLKSVSTVYDVVKTTKEVKDAVDDINNHTENIFGYGKYGESYTPKKLSQTYSFDSDYASHCKMIYDELSCYAPVAYSCTIDQFDETKIAEFKKNIITEDRAFGKDFIDIYGDKMVTKAIEIIY